MPTELEYMQFASRVYASSDNNKIGVPEGWSQIDWLPDQGSGFSAGVYKNNATNEIVISFRLLKNAQMLRFPHHALLRRTH